MHTYAVRSFEALVFLSFLRNVSLWLVVIFTWIMQKIWHDLSLFIFLHHKNQGCVEFLYPMQNTCKYSNILLVLWSLLYSYFKSWTLQNIHGRRWGSAEISIVQVCRGIFFTTAKHWPSHIYRFHCEAEEGIIIFLQHSLHNSIWADNVNLPSLYLQ